MSLALKEIEQIEKKQWASPKIICFY